MRHVNNNTGGVDDNRPLLILDLDGVISPYGTETQDGLQLARVGGYRLLYRPDVIEALNEIRREGVIDLRWSTSWGNTARTHVAPTLGLADFPLLDTLDQTNTMDASPKLDAIRRHIDTGRRFAWIDDDLTPPQQCRLKAAYRSDCLLLRPSPTVGVATADIAVVRDFLTAP